MNAELVGGEHYPLRETVMLQTGVGREERASFLRA
jgi:hypothetical protein